MRKWTKFPTFFDAGRTKVKSRKTLDDGNIQNSNIWIKLTINETSFTLFLLCLFKIKCDCSFELQTRSQARNDKVCIPMCSP